MSGPTIHMAMDVRGALNWPTRIAKKWMRTLTVDGRPCATVGEFRNALMDALASGFEVIPMATCDNFDPKDGCRGHAEPAHD